MAYRQPDLEEISRLAKQAEASQKNSDGIRRMVMKNGNNVVIVLPPYNDKGLFVKKVFTHWNLGEGGKVYYECVQATYPEDMNVHCPICQVNKLLSDNGFEDEVKDYLPRAQSHFNVLVKEIGSEEVDVDEFPLLPHILRGPSSLGDFINKACFEKLSKGFYNPEKAIPLQIKRIEKKVKGRSNTSYEFQWVPEKEAIASTEEEREAILSQMYDLDKVFKKKWDGEIFDTGVALASAVLDSRGFKAPKFYGRPNDSDKEENTETEEPKKKTTKREIVNKEEQVEESSPQKIEKKKTEPKVSTSSVVRDPSVVDPDSGQPLCFGHVDSCDACNSCDFQDVCIIETVRLRAKK